MCGGVVGNLHALRALLLQAQRLEIPAAQMIITGDLAAYCADGAACADLIRRDLAEALVIRGNCERTLAQDEADCGCGFVAGSQCSTLAVSWYRHAQRTLSAEIKQWFATLPPQAEVEFGGRRLKVLHGGSDADNTFIFPSQAQAQCQHLAALGAAQRSDGVLAGHCGIPFTRACAHGIWHNSGALGMPANDGTARVWYALWHETPDGIRIEHHALDYDHHAAAAAMQRAGLPPAYRHTLVSGIWPSNSILPAAERQQQGEALPAAAYLWQAGAEGMSGIMRLAECGSVAQLVRAHA